MLKVQSRPQTMNVVVLLPIRTINVIYIGNESYSGKKILWPKAVQVQVLSRVQF